MEKCSNLTISLSYFDAKVLPVVCGRNQTPIARLTLVVTRQHKFRLTLCHFIEMWRTSKCRQSAGVQFYGYGHALVHCVHYEEPHTLAIHVRVYVFGVASCNAPIEMCNLQFNLIKLRKVFGLVKHWTQNILNHWYRSQQQQQPTNTTIEISKRTKFVPSVPCLTDYFDAAPSSEKKHSKSQRAHKQHTFTQTYLKGTKTTDISNYFGWVRREFY